MESDKEIENYFLFNSRLNNKDRERERDNLSEFDKMQVVFIKISKVL